MGVCVCVCLERDIRITFSTTSFNLLLFAVFVWSTIRCLLEGQESTEMLDISKRTVNTNDRMIFGDGAQVTYVIWTQNMKARVMNLPVADVFDRRLPCVTNMSLIDQCREGMNDVWGNKI